MIFLKSKVKIARFLDRHQIGELSLYLLACIGLLYGVVSLVVIYWPKKF